MSEPTAAELRLLEHLVSAVEDSSWRTEPVHEQDCPACDLASDIAGTLATTWDPNDTWHETPVSDGLPGDTLLDQATRVAAYVLHRRLPGHRQPKEKRR